MSFATKSIVEIGVDEQQGIYVVPDAVSFPYIYREAMEISWDQARQRLHGPKPERLKQASMDFWLEQIMHAAIEQHYMLVLTTKTNWVNVSNQQRQRFEEIFDRVRSIS